MWSASGVVRGRMMLLVIGLMGRVPGWRIACGRCGSSILMTIRNFLRSRKSFMMRISRFLLIPRVSGVVLCR